MSFCSTRLSDRSARSMLHMDLHFHSIKIQMVQELLPRDLNMRRNLCTKLLQIMDTLPQFLQNFITSDEALISRISGTGHKKTRAYCTNLGQRHSSSGKSLASHRGGPGSSPGLIMWDLWCTKWRWGRFSPSTSVPPANFHSTNCSTITLIYHLGFVQ
jgi:hypothetical protein